MQKTVLILDAYYEPEIIAFSHLEKDLIEGIIEKGYKVKVICPTPTRGISAKTAKEYKKIKKEIKNDGNLEILRFSAPQEGKSVVLRAIRYFWCNFRTIHFAKKSKADLIFSNSTPPTQGYISGKVAKKKNIPFLYSLQDVFPDSLVSTGLTKEGSVLWKIGRFIENRTYLKADKIITISNSMKNNLLTKGVSEKKLEIIPNWVDTQKIRPVLKSENKLISELGVLPDSFIVVYAGNMGESQNVDIILDVAKDFSSKNILFLLFGSGSEFDRIKERVKQENINNIIIRGLMPPDRISEVYSLGDLALITGKKGVGKTGLPSKTWSIMACNTPIVASFDTDSALSGVLEKSGGGTCVEPENKKLLAKEIEKKYNEWSLNIKTECNSRDYVKNNLSKQICVSRYLREIENITFK